MGQRAATFLERLGFGDLPADPRTTWRLVLALLLLYAVSFVAFYPSAVTNWDESMYINQTRLILDGGMTVSVVEPVSGETNEYLPSTYTVGPALLMTPLVWAAGWRGAFVIPCLSLLLAVFLTARWLADEQRSPIFAALVLGFPPALVMGRVAMSDVPSVAAVALGLWLFWRGLDRGERWWLASGFVAGASLLFRASNALVFAPLYAGTVLRGDKRCWALVVGGLVGVALRLLAMDYFFGDALYDRSRYRFAPHTIEERLPLYLLGLLILVPGGLLFSLAYRGRRRPEVIVTILLFFAFYLFQKHSTATTGVAKRIVLALRYFIPLLPLMAFAMAESMPRLWQRARERWPRPSVRLEPALAALLALWLAGVASAALAVHPLFHRWSAGQAGIRSEIARHVAPDAVFVTNLPATRKFLDEISRKYEPVDRSHFEPQDVPELAQRYGEVYLVLLDRSDSAYWRRDMERNAAYVAELEPIPEPLVDRYLTSTDRLRIWRIASPDGSS